MHRDRNGGNHQQTAGWLDQGSMLLGELRHGHHVTTMTLARIESELKVGAQVHVEHNRRLTDAEREIADLKTAKEKPPPIEVWLKHVATVAIPLGTLWATGSFEKALAVYAKMHGVAIP